MNEHQSNGMDFAGERLKRSHFHERQKAFNVRESWSAWNSYKFALCYYDPGFEYFCVRNLCGTYDICPMQKYRIEGPDAEAMLNRMVTRDVARQPVGRVSYVVWCTDDGRIVDDGTIFRLAEDQFMLTCGSSCIAWLRQASLGFEDLRVTDVSDEIAALSLQGPTSCAVLKKMGLTGIENARRFDIRQFPFHGDTLIVSRTGFTGDLGYELWVRSDLALTMWDELYAAGADYGIQPFGEEATNMARLEAGLIMPEMEFNEALKTVNFRHDHSPLELGMEWIVDFDKPHFNGRRALLEEKRKGPRFRLLRLDIPGNKVAEGAIIYHNERCAKSIGYVTSAMWSPAVKANIALAMIESDFLKNDLWVEIYFYKDLRPYRKVVKATLRDKPFWTPARVNATPPADF